MTNQDNDSWLTQALTEVGADENYIAKALMDMTTAYKEVHTGDWETITIADNNIRHKAIETILKIRGDLKEKRNTLRADTQVNYIIVN